jgi:hypothetical protein
MSEPQIPLSRGLAEIQSPFGGRLGSMSARFKGPYLTLEELGVIDKTLAKANFLSLASTVNAFIS